MVLISIEIMYMYINLQRGYFMIFQKLTGDDLLRIVLEKYLNTELI